MISFIKKGLLILGAMSIISIVPINAKIIPLSESEKLAIESSSVKAEYQSLHVLKSLVRLYMCENKIDEYEFDKYYNNVLCDITIIDKNPLIRKLLSDLLENNSCTSDITCVGTILNCIINHFASNTDNIVIYANRKGEFLLNKLFDCENRQSFQSALYKMNHMTRSEALGDSLIAKVYRELLKKLIY